MKRKLHLNRIIQGYILAIFTFSPIEGHALKKNFFSFLLYNTAQPTKWKIFNENHFILCELIFHFDRHIINFNILNFSENFQHCIFF